MKRSLLLTLQVFLWSAHGVKKVMIKNDAKLMSRRCRLASRVKTTDGWEVLNCGYIKILNVCSDEQPWSDAMWSENPNN